MWIDSVKSATGSEFVYDENGNPISIDALQFNWTNGHQLSSITYEEDGTEYTLISYTYDDSGIRTSKTFGETTTYYTTINGTITSQYELDENENVINLIEFLYDSNNGLIGFTYDKNTYFYIKNAQDDVTDIVDAEGNVLASYLYYAWGITTTYDKSGINLGTINPMRYRSYYYDEGIDSYYLQTRYYMPELGRFLNSDLPTIAQKCKDYANGLNLFAYCNNDPVNNSDPNGTIALRKVCEIILGGVFGALMQFVSDCIAILLNLRKGLSTVGSYLSSVLQGALDSFLHKGWYTAVLVAALGNFVKQMVDLLVYKKIPSIASYIHAVVSTLIQYVAKHFFKVKLSNNVSRALTNKIPKSIQYIYDYVIGKLQYLKYYDFTQKTLKSLLNRTISNIFAYVRQTYLGINW